MHGRRRRRSPLHKDVKMWKWNGKQIIVDDSTLSPTIKDVDDYGNKTVRYNYINKEGKEESEVIYKNKPRGASPWEKTIPEIRKKPTVESLQDPVT